MWPTATLCWKVFIGVAGGFFELVYNSAMKGDLKFFPVGVLWVVSSRNDSGNNGTNGKVGKNGTFSILGLGFGVWKRDRGEDFGGCTWGSGVTVWVQWLGAWCGGFGVWVKKNKTLVCHFTYFSICAIITCAIFTCTSFT